MKKISEKFQKGVRKKIASLSVISLLLNLIMTGVLLAPSENILQAVADSVDTQQQICENTPVDVVLVMDRSGSMDLGSCLTASYGIYENVTETWCDLYSGSFTPDDIPSRLAQAQDAAGLFLGKLGDNDHSALVSYASSATLDKGLNDIHLITDGLWSTEIKINELVATGGTNIGEAIERGTIELNNTGRADATKTMILLTDGKPTCPEINSSYSECGYVEDQGDIDFAQEKAQEADLAGIKVFTIGLGDDVNTELLTDIASITGAQYYPAANGDFLDDIYNLISEEICYSSISGCKYGADINGNIDINDKLSGWEIVLSGDANLSQSTINGCYSFQNLPAGYYTVSEGLNVDKQPYLQTYPTSLIYNNVSLGGQDLNGFDFGNYFPICGNGILDSSYGEECDDGPTGSPECTSECILIDLSYQCSDGIDNDNDGLTDEEDPGCHSDGDETNSLSYVPTDDDETDNLINPGDIVINEIMQNPEVVSDSDGEWFELFNATGEDINIDGCTIADNGRDTHVIDNGSNSLILPANSYLVLADNGESSLNGGVLADYVYSSIALSNTDDEIILTCQNIEIDRVEYDGGPAFPDPTGKSMILSDTHLDNNDGANWCESNSIFGDGDLGSPGTVNDSCAQLSNGVISGYKFNDLNGNGIWDVTDDGNDANDELGLSEWTIDLYKDTIDNLIDTTSTIVLSLGYYEFKNLVAGTYFVKEVSQTGWQQTTPFDPNYYELTILGDEISENNNFGNQEPAPPIFECSDGLDNDSDGWIDILDPTCHSDGDWENDNSYLPERNNELNTPPVISLLNPSITINVGTNFDPANGHATADDVEDGDITSKIISSGSVDVNVLGTYLIDYNVTDSEEESALTQTFVVNVITQGCVSNCGGGGGTVITKPVIKITNEKVFYLGDGKADVTWTTNIETTEQVAYGDESITALGSPPTYGYDLVNDESGSMTKEHKVTITGLTEQSSYYFRPIADRAGSTGEKIGIEVFYELGEVKGVESPVEEPEAPVASDVPCNYLLEYIKLGADNNPAEVEKLETFLNVFEGEKLAINGIYEQVDFDAVSRFQSKYDEQVLLPWSYDNSTGYVYITTKKKINEIFCEMDFPLTSDQEDEVALFRSRFISLLDGSVQEPQGDQQFSSTEQERDEKDEVSEELMDKENGEVKGVEDEEEIIDDQKSLAPKLSDVSTIGSEAEDERINEGQEEKSPLLAGIGYIFTLGTGNAWLDFLIGIAILLIIGGIIYHYLKRERQKKK